MTTPETVRSPKRDAVSVLVDIAATCENPGSVALYASAACKACRDAEKSADLERAILIAAMMSQRLVSIAARARAETACRSADLLTREMQHASDVVTADSRPRSRRRDDPLPAGSHRRTSSLNGRVHLPEELLRRGRSRASARRFDAGHGWATLWVAGLRLAGLQPEQVLQVSFRDGRDAVLVWIDNEALLIQGHRLRRRAELQRPSRLFIERAFNDAICLGPMPLAELDRPAVRAAAAKADAGGIVPADYRFPLSHATSDEERDAMAAELAFRVREAVFTRSAEAPDSVFTLALYAHQTLLVHRPEAYALASRTDPAVARFARQLADVDELLVWMRHRIEPGSIFLEPDRVMLAGQVLEHRVARPLDRAMLVFAVLSRQGWVARIVQTTRGVYVLARDRHGTLLIDTEGLSLVDSPEGVVVLAFDAARQYGYRDAWTLPEEGPVPETPPLERPAPVHAEAVGAVVA